MNNAYRQPFVIGMDGGGTKTKVCCADAHGQVFDVLEGGSMNINSLGVDGVQRNMAAIFDELQNRGAAWEQLKAICLGAAGVSNPLTRETLRASVKAAGIGAEPIIMGDHQAALYGACQGAKGMILIAGTGSVCYGQDGQGKEARAGGWGHLIDDEGSGYALGRDVLAAVVQAEDGRVAPTCMRDAVLRAAGASDIAGLIRWVYAPETGKKEIAALAPYVMLGWENKEAAAEAILDKAADNLAQLVGPVARKLSMEEGELAFCGSVITQNEVLIQKLKQRIAQKLPALRCIAPREDAAKGAVLRCLEDI